MQIQVKDELTSPVCTICPQDSASNVVAPAEASEVSIAPASSASSSGGMSSILSAGGGSSKQPGGHCFLAQALLKTDISQYLEARHLAAGDFVLSASGESLRVESVVVHAAQEQAMIELVAGRQHTAHLKVTPSHSVMVQRGPSPQTIPAGSLHEGDHVYCGNQVLQP